MTYTKKSTAQIVKGILNAVSALITIVVASIYFSQGQKGVGITLI